MFKRDAAAISVNFRCGKKRSHTQNLTEMAKQHRPSIDHPYNAFLQGYV